MSMISYGDFAPYHSGSEWPCDGEADESDLLLITPSDLDILSNSEGDQQKTIPLSYNPVNFQHLNAIPIVRLVQSLEGKIMKRITLFTLLVGLFFGALSSAAALPPLQYYVRWGTSVQYTCTGSSGGYELFVAVTHLDYLAPNVAMMTETDITDNSFGHFVTHQETESDWMNFSGTRQHTTYTIESGTYPITLQAILKTYVNGVAVYQSTFTARCTSNSHGELSAIITNIANPLTTGSGLPSPGISNP